MRMRNNRSKIRWDLAGHVSPEFKPGNNRSLGARVAQLRQDQSRLGVGRERQVKRCCRVQV